MTGEKRACRSKGKTEDKSPRFFQLVKKTRRDFFDKLGKERDTRPTPFIITYLN